MSDRRRRIIWTGLLILLFFTVQDESDWIYDGGFYIISAMTLLIIASVVHPSTLVSKLLGNPLFVYIGKRSYSLYLWHFLLLALYIVILLQVKFHSMFTLWILF